MMKTAKETLEEAGILEQLRNMNYLDHVLEAMQAYATAACKEQREICAKQFYGEGDIIPVTGMLILNAPQPQLL